MLIKLKKIISITLAVVVLCSVSVPAFAKNGKDASNYSKELLATLDENGKYRVNSSGETYGSSSLAEFVGEKPDLYSVLLNGISGYLRETEANPPEFNFKTPEEVVAYYKKNPTPEKRTISIYDCEGVVIGSTVIEVGVRFSSGGITLEEAQAMVNAGDVIKNVPATSAKVFVNGKSVEFDSYTISENNYFKLRDIASVISGTEKQFDVFWDASKKSISLLPNKGYTVVGGEMKKGDGTSKTAILNKSEIFLNDEKLFPVSYTIDGNNYFKLRTICKIFDVGVTWDELTNTIKIDTDKEYID